MLVCQLFGCLFADISDTELVNEFAVFDNISLSQIVQQAFPLTNQGQESATTRVILAVFLQVVGQYFDALGEQGDLTFNGAGVFFRATILLEYLRLLLFC